MRPNLKKAAKRVAIAGAVLIGGGTLPIIPSELVMDYAYQYPVNPDPLTALPDLSGQTTTPATSDDDAFADHDGNGVISVAAYPDSKGNQVKVQIDDERYAAMGRKNGAKQNPKETEHRSLIDELVNPKRAEAAIAFDSATEDKTAAATSLTYAHTVSGSERFLYVALTTLSNTHTGTAATYNGTAMTAVAQNIAVFGSTWQHHGFRLVAPDTGTNNVVVSADTVDFSLRSGAVSYTGVDQSTPIQDSGTASSPGTGNNMTISLTTSDDGWAVISGANVDAAFVAGLNTDTLRASYGGLADIADSDGDVTAGTFNAQMTHSGSRGYGGIALSLLPGTGGGGGGDRRIIRVTGPW